MEYLLSFYLPPGGVLSAFAFGDQRFAFIESADADHVSSTGYLFNLFIPHRPNQTCFAVGDEATHSFTLRAPRV